MKYNKTLFFACAAALTLMASCSKEENKHIKFYGTVETQEAKCLYDPTGNVGVSNVVWAMNEPIVVFGASGVANYEVSDITDNTATFGHVDGANVDLDPIHYAVSNFITGTNTLNADGTLTVNINSNVTDFGGKVIPFMAAKTDNQNLHFKHLGGMLALSCTPTLSPNEKTYVVKSVTISSNSHKLAGEYQITFDATTPLLTDPSTSNTPTTLTYTSTSTQWYNAGVAATVYLPIVPGTYDNFTINFYYETRKKNGGDLINDNASFTRSLNSGNFTIEAGKVYTLNLN